MPGDVLDGVLPLLTVGTADAASGGALLRPFVGALAISYVVQEGDLIRPLGEADLVAFGGGERRVHERSVENLARYVEKTGIKLRSHGSIMAVQFDGDWEATLMLYPPMWKHLVEEMGDELVVVVPARDVLAVSPADSPEGLAELDEVIERVWPRDDHRLSEEFFLWKDARWQVAG